MSDIKSQVRTPPTAKIRRRDRTGAWLMQVTFPLIRPPKALRFATRPIAKPEEIMVPTRHGQVRCLVYRPHPDAPLAGGPGPAPVHIQIHGGAFIGRFPEQDNHIADYIASEVGAYVVSIDYDVAPQHRFPVAEEQSFDVARWVHDHGTEWGWDADRMSVGGGSAGGKLAINVVQQAHAAGGPSFRAIIPCFAAADVTRTDRTSPKSRPVVPPWMQRLVANTYFVDESIRSLPLASPVLDPDLAAAMPPALIMTGALDTLGPEMDALAERLAAEGVEVTHRRFADTDHGFTHFKPVETAREAITLMGDHLLANLA